MQKREITLTNRTGKRLVSTIRRADVPKATIVLSHGLGGWKEQPLLVMVADVLCERGYNVFTFDAVDGAKGPDGDFLHSTTTGFVEDLEDVVRYIKNQEWYMPELILAGHSMGGLVSLHYTRLHPAEVSKLVLLAPAVSWKAGLNPLVFIGGIWWLLRNKNTTPGPDHSRLPLDKGWLKDFMKFDMMKDAPYVSAPTLIISASRDGTVARPAAHFALARRFANATCIVIAGAGHIFWKHERQVGDTITKWLTSS